MDEKSFKTKKASKEADVIDFYNQYAGDWDKRFGSQKSTRHFLNRRWNSFKKLVPKKNNLVALELGVGTGVYIHRCAPLFRKIIAVDGSKKMISELKKKLKNSNITNVETHVSDVLKMSFVKNSSVDVVYFFGLIEHIIRTDDFINEIKRVLRPGGVVIGVTPNGRSLWYTLRSAVRSTGKHCSTDTYYSDRELKRVFTRQEFCSFRCIHWGAVPAGVNSLMFILLLLIEKVMELGLFRKQLGGITFALRKRGR